MRGAGQRSLLRGVRPRFGAARTRRPARSQRSAAVVDRMDRHRHRRPRVLQTRHRPRWPRHRRVPGGLPRTPNHARTATTLDRPGQPQARCRARDRSRHPPGRPRRIHAARRPADPGFRPDDHRPRIDQRNKPQRQRRPARQRRRNPTRRRRPHSRRRLDHDHGRQVRKGNGHDRAATGSCTTHASNWRRAGKSSRRSDATSPTRAQSSTPSLEYAARLCGAAAAQLFLATATCSACRGSPAKPPRNTAVHGGAPDRPQPARRPSAAPPKTCAPIQIPDVLDDADYGRLDLQRLTGFRTLLSTPMILQDEVVGVLSMWRTDVAPFDDRERKLLEEFAVQGAIVLRQVDLMRALESRGIRAVGQGRATRSPARSGRSGRLEPGPRRGPRTHRQQRRAVDQSRLR